MRKDIQRILRLEVPLIVRLGTRPMTVREVLSLVPGGIIQLPKDADEELELLVNNKLIGSGTAVKIGENFGIRITFVGDLGTRIEALGPAEPPADAAAEEAAALAAQLLSNQV